MSAIRAALIAASLTLATPCLAQVSTDEVRAEIIDWVVKPCMTVTVALSVGDIEQEQLDAGITQEFITQMMVANRESAIRTMAEKIHPYSTWHERGAAYRAMLHGCLTNAIDVMALPTSVPTIIRTISTG